MSKFIGGKLSDGDLKDLKKEGAEREEKRAKELKYVVCQHIAYPNLMGFPTGVVEIKTKTKTGDFPIHDKIMACNVCSTLVGKLTQENVTKYFTMLPAKDIQQGLMFAKIK